MLYINTDLVDLSNRKEDYRYHNVVKEYHEYIRSLKENLGDIIFYRTAKQPKKDKSTGFMRPAKKYGLSYRTTVIGDGGEEKWVYSMGSAKVKDGELVLQSNHFIVKNGELMIDLRRQPDLAYFLSKHHDVKKGIITLYNPDAIEEAEAKKHTKEVQAKELIYSPSSILSNDPNRLRMLAKKWGVSEVDKKNDAGVKNALYKAVSRNEQTKQNTNATHPGFAEFISDVGGGELVELAADVQVALDKEVLRFDFDTNEWLLTVSEDKKPLPLMVVSGGDIAKRRAVLTDYLSRNKPDAQMLRDVISGNIEVKKGRVSSTMDVDFQPISADEIDTCDDYMRMQKHGKYILGITGRPKPKEELRELIRNSLVEKE